MQRCERCRKNVHTTEIIRTTSPKELVKTLEDGTKIYAYNKSKSKTIKYEGCVEFGHNLDRQ